MQVTLRYRLLLTLLLLGSLFLSSVPQAPVYAVTSCAQILGDGNLIKNGTMREGSLSPYGPVSDGWTAFIMEGEPPRFEWVDNEGIDENGSQYIWADAQTFDAGLYQVVGGLTPNQYYRAWIGYAQRRYDPGDTKNHAGDKIGAMIGVDPTGGTDPHSPNVQWSGELLAGSALNNPVLDKTFAAQADHVTIYLRAINHQGEYRNKVWFDSICMEARPEMPTATLVATATPTLAPTSTPAPTVAIAAAAAPAKTKLPTNTPTLLPTDTPTPLPTDTPTVTLTRTETPKPRRAIPLTAAGGTESGSAAARTDGTTSRSEAASTSGSGLSALILIASVGVIGVSVLGILGLVAFIVLKLRRPRADYAPFDDLNPIQYR